MRGLCIPIATVPTRNIWKTRKQRYDGGSPVLSRRERSRVRPAAPTPLVTSVSRLAPMPHRQHHDIFPVIMIEADIGSVSELNQPLPELRRQLFDRAATLRLPGKALSALTNCLHRALGRVATLGN